MTSRQPWIGVLNGSASDRHLPAHHVLAPRAASYERWRHGRDECPKTQWKERESRDGGWDFAARALFVPGHQKTPSADRRAEPTHTCRCGLAERDTRPSEIQE